MKDYYDATVRTVLVPVKVRYHDATDTVYSFEPPTLEAVEAAVKTKNTPPDCRESAREYLDKHYGKSVHACRQFVSAIPFEDDVLALAAWMDTQIQKDRDR